MGSYTDTESQEKFEIICICGESGSGKTFLANKIKNKLILENNINPVLLDGDAVRKYINYNLGYSNEDRKLNNEIISNIAELFYHQGHQVIISTVRADIAFELLRNKNIPCNLIKL